MACLIKLQAWQQLECVIDSHSFTKLPCFVDLDIAFITLTIAIVLQQQQISPHEL